jgi:hypothetical protein
MTALRLEPRVNPKPCPRTSESGTSRWIPRSRTTLRGMLVALLLAVGMSPTSGFAQATFEVTIQVTSTSGEAVATAYVGLLDPDERIVAGASTDAAGRAVLRVPREGVYQIQVERLGYDTWLSEEREFQRDGPGVIPVVVEARALAVEGVTAFGEGRCNTPVEDGPAIVRLVELSRELLGRVIETEARIPSYHARIIIEEPERPQARFQVFDTMMVDVTRGQGAPAPDQLVRRGFIVPAPLEPWWAEPEYHAVTPEVAVSTAFLESRCLGVADHPDSAWTGLSYRPLPDSEVYDVRGTIWLDTIQMRPARIESHWVGVRDFLWDHERARLRRMMAGFRDETGNPDLPWGQTMAERRMLGRAMRRQIGPHRQGAGLSAYNMGSANDRDFGSMVEFSAIFGGWVTSRAKIRFPQLSGEHWQVFARGWGLHPDRFTSQQVYQRAITVEWTGLARPRSRAPTYDCLRCALLRELPDAARSPVQRLDREPVTRRFR